MEGWWHIHHTPTEAQALQGLHLPSFGLGPLHLRPAYLLATKQFAAPCHTFYEEVEWPVQVSSPHHLFLPNSNGGLDLPHLITIYKKIHVAKAASHMYSSDSIVQAIATQDTLCKTNQQWSLFCPHHEVVEVMKVDPGASTKHVISQVKAEDTAARLAHTTSLPVQWLTVREF